jgi:gamma-butyrobetaine dioxygenase
LLKVSDLPTDISVVAVRQSGDRVEIEFAPDGHRAVFSAHWLGQFADLGSSKDPERLQIPPGWSGLDAYGWAEDGRSEDAKRLWTGSGIGQNFAQGSWPLFLAEPAHQDACLTAVLRDGFAVLSDVPCQPGAVLAVAELISVVRDTEHGRLVDVQPAEAPADLAYTQAAYDISTTFPFRDPLSTLKFLHCLRDADHGGESLLVDGFRAASELRAADPDSFLMLTNTPVTFAYADARMELRATRPIITLDPRGRIREVRFGHWYVQPVRLPAEDIVRFYRAYRAFAELISRPDLMLTFKLRPGDCLILDNTRVLIGRTGFSGGQRHLQVCCADLDGLASTVALLHRRRHNGRARR